ncbi:MAG: FHA domain-containing protein [Actinomycetota bacterium]
MSRLRLVDDNGGSRNPEIAPRRSGDPSGTPGGGVPEWVEGSLAPAVVLRAGSALRPVGPLPAMPAKVCDHGHPNDPDAEVCWICTAPFAGAVLVERRSPHPVARLLLEDGTAVDLATDLVIGRSPRDDADGADTLTVTDPKVSRHHLRLETAGWRPWVRDCDSTNGTFLSRPGERGRRRVGLAEPSPLHLGDTIHFGSRRARIVGPGGG